MSIIVFGSINIDLAAKTPRLPQPGETIIGSNFFTAGGGKGANQAVAAARLGTSTHLIGRVGNDNFAEELLTSLQSYGLSTENILIDKSTHSGVAIIAVDETGQNNIIVIPGANNNVGDADIEGLKKVLPSATSLLLQLEIPLEVVLKAAKVARELGVRVILDPAPAVADLPIALYPLIDIITPNEVEAGQLAGFRVNDTETAMMAAKQLQERGVKNVIVKLGDRGAVAVTADESFFVPAFAVEAIDTVAAGDAFNGGLAAALDGGRSLSEAVVWGCAAGALCATKVGAQVAMPDRTTFDNFLQHNLV
ncbi:MAG: ribokinase [Microcoleus sp. PH2017_10_PVI_O_A]|uniref:ribokinase n=1 Tax=unclassified Microcoleus TaxID=2642155 RepID=UPI001D7F98EF|nr:MULTISPECIES: ribokinase [unclassified Microcoleus]TAE84445.1 MAG: ribokinase [Oscillatoriales cyanobacterium]MCC3405211.1 ribokinase [Microcoleus sp. PH2017_10_PVI_O_A]MCC3459298.1 ribokinase [Microcoleus sp. PH2017_11_PCY_U_A]MCC3477387.1 ribokinase [Microcoleus sp. PH2017_12_PCY_D_A]MCC3558480.1 ribokinase [Microcoleus sp. PH2017_27_LUM_O_A]